MKTSKFILIVFAIHLLACQPQTESRQHMDLASNRMSDSILKLLDSSFAQPYKVLAQTESPIASSASSFTTINPSK